MTATTTTGAFALIHCPEADTETNVGADGRTCHMCEQAADDGRHRPVSYDVPLRADQVFLWSDAEIVEILTDCVAIDAALGTRPLGHFEHMRLAQRHYIRRQMVI